MFDVVLFSLPYGSPAMALLGAEWCEGVYFHSFVSIPRVCSHLAFVQILTSERPTRLVRQHRQDKHITCVFTFCVMSITSWSPPLDPLTSSSSRFVVVLFLVLAVGCSNHWRSSDVVQARRRLLDALLALTL